MDKGNAALHRAKREKNDEFYTQKKDIENELIHYHSHLKDKIVYCNCDDYRKSKFVEYFMENFEKIGLKKLVSTGFSKDGQGTYSEYDGTVFKTGFLSGNGDALEEECTEILKQADVVVTNCPFSLFRKYVRHLMKYGKKFIIIGNTNGITYKEIFPYIKNNELWLGCSSFNSGMYFCVPNDYEYADTYKFDRERNGDKVMRVSSICWYTNIEHSRRNTPLDLYEKYSATKFSKYDNYDAIEVSKVSDIPMDYEGVMGVPITFLDKYCPTQFEIIGGFNGYKECDYENALLCGTPTEYVDKNGKTKIWTGPTINKKTVYYRILIRRKKAEPIVEAQ